MIVNYIYAIVTLTFTRLRRSKPGDHDRAQLALTSPVDFDIVCKEGDDL